MGGLQAAKLMCGKADPVKSQLLVVFAIFKYNCSNFMHKYILNSKTCSNPTSFLPKIWNENSLNQKHIKSLNSFKNSLQKLFISTYPPHVNCESSLCDECKP